MDRPAKLEDPEDPPVISPIRILCLGNTLLADDAVGCILANQLRRGMPSLDVVETTGAGLDLLDFLHGVSCLVVVDSLQTGSAPPGTIYFLRERDVKSVSGPSPHYVGLFETLALAKALHLPVPKEVFILGVETADCTTLGGPMSQAVQEAIPAALEVLRQIAIAAGRSGSEKATDDIAALMAEPLRHGQPLSILKTTNS